MITDKRKKQIFKIIEKEFRNNNIKEFFDKIKDIYPNEELYYIGAVTQYLINSQKILKFKTWLNNNVEYQESDRLFNKLKEIFGDWEE